MRHRLLGRTGLRVSELFLGAMSFGEPGGGAPLAECRRILDVYAEAGGNVVDTAVTYRGGRSEEIVGELLAGRRDRFVVASKYGVSRDRSDPNAGGGHRKNLMLSLETSLKRLRTDYIDVYWIHLWDPYTPLEELMRALDDAVRSGKVLYVGVSDAPAWVVARANTLAEWRGWSAFAGLQVPYSLLQRDIERELLPMAEAFGMTVAAWSPLGHGVLTGKHLPEGLRGEHLAEEPPVGSEHAVVRAVVEVARELGVTPAQVAVAYTRARSRAVHPIMGARTAEQLAENLRAVDVVLPEESLRRLEAATDFTPGFPGDFLAQAAPSAFGDHLTE
ncbi:aldo/keto reductase [Streptomyces sp. NPDC015346]|uniref:aldo/keto reductase n=1 Tax=Streptomyces sp. NPDC015346 TaxID=3364954 RepID=UPI00370007E7